MKDFLENLEIGEEKVHLSKDEIKAIMAKHGTVVENEKGKIIESKDNEISTQKTTIEELKKQIEGMPTSDDVEALKTKIKEYEDAEIERKKVEKEAREKSIRDERTNAFFNEVKFASESAKAGVIAQFNEKGFKYDEESNKFLGANEWLEDLKARDTGAFLSDVANPKFTTGTSAPNNGNSMDAILNAMGLSEEK